MNDNRKQRYVLQVHVGSYSRLYEALSIEAEKNTTAREIVDCICEKLGLTDGTDVYELAEVIGNQGGQDCKERRIGPNECPIALKLLWPKKHDKGTALVGGHVDYKFCLRRKWMGNLWPLSMSDSNDSQLIRDYFLRFLYQPRNSEYPDLCQLPDLTEQTLLDNLKARFEKNHIYTYVGSILIAVNPFTFYPIYNPKYVQLYQNRRLGDLPPHIFAIADAAYQSMLRKRTNQCIVISGESGSGKTESTNLLLHHLTALSQKGTHGTGVEQTILGAGPVLEAFGNAKTKFNNNSSRFGKFIQVNYKENGAVHGALVQKYLLEKSRIVSQVKSERNYHVFYYLLDGLSIEDKEKLYLTKPQDYFYLNQSKCFTLEGVDERHEFFRLTQSMEMVGFSRQKQFLCFSVLSAVLHLGNVQFSKKSTYHSDETVMIKNPEVVTIISKLLNVKEETLTAALTCKRTKAAKGEMLVINYKLPDAIATRDAMAKCLYGVLFDWIVMQVNHALLSKKDNRDHKGNSIGVLDIFGFEDFGDHNNFEQFCINYANERLQYYFNSHVFKYEQEEYQREGISWRNIDFNDNTECLGLIEDKPDGLLYLLDDQCNFPCGSDETILQKFIYHHNSNALFEVPPCRGSAFTIKHYAGKVKYQIRDFREKNLDLMRPDIVAVLKVSKMAFVRELVCSDPLALFRWHILKAFFKAYFHFTKLREISKMKRGLSGTYLVKEYANANQRRSTQHNQLRKKKYSSSSTTSSISSSTISSSSASTLWQRKNGFEKSIRNFKLLKQLLGPQSSSIINSSSSSLTTSLSTTITTTKERPISVSRTVITRKQTQTVTHQFQQSLQQLMDTLSHANPFFVRCIKSNAEKMPNHFDDRLVLQQLRYTGMLETVRIRQSGYSVRLTFDEFIQHYRILLPKGLLSSKLDVQKFLLNMKLPSEMYQIGKTKVFMRESEKLALDERLHEEILRRIINLQRWVRTWICRKRFNEMRNAAVIVQTFVRRFIAQKRLKRLKMIAQYENWAANAIQKHWRAYQTRKWFTNLRKSIVKFQACCRGHLFRKTNRMNDVIEQCARAREQSQKETERKSSTASTSSLSNINNNNKMSNVSVLIRATPPNSTSTLTSSTSTLSSTTSSSTLTTTTIKEGDNSTTTTTTTSSSTVYHQNQNQNEIVIHNLSFDSDTNQDANLIIPVNVINQQPAATIAIGDQESSLGIDVDEIVITTNNNQNNYDDDDDDYNDEDVDDNELVDLDDDFENGDNQQVHLNRKRNIPIRKTSFKRKANNKSLSDSDDKQMMKTTTTSTSESTSTTTTTTNATSSASNPTIIDDNLNNHQQQQQHHRQLTKLSSDSKVLALAASNSSFVSSGYLTNSDSASSIHKLRIGSANSNNSEHQQQYITSITSVSSDLVQSQHPPSTCTTITTTTTTSTTTTTKTTTNIPYSINLTSTNQLSVSNRTLTKHQTFDESQIPLPSTSLSSSSSTTTTTSSGPIQKAKATFRNIMGKSTSNSEINKRLLKQTMSVKSGMEFESANLNEALNQKYTLLNIKSLSNNDLGQMKVSEMPNVISKNSTSQSDIHSQLNSVFSSINAPTPYNFHNAYHNHNQNHLHHHQNFNYNYNNQQQQQLKPKDKNFTLLSRHSIHDESSFKSGEICAICENSILVQQPLQQQQSNQAQIHLKCSECKQLFHRKCIHLSSDIPCIKEGSNINSSLIVGAFNNPPRPPRNKQKKAKISAGKSIDSTSTKENQVLTSQSSKQQSVRVKQFIDPHDMLITDLDELTLMDKFISKKIREMDDSILFKKKANNNEHKESMVDTVFKLALKEFKNNLISTYSTHQNGMVVQLTYKDLIDHFAQILLNVCEIENTYKSFPVILGVNAFRGYMDELRNKEEKMNGPNLKKSNKRKQSKKRTRNKKEDDVYKTFEHEFYISTANIYTVCEVCDSYVWMMERIFICRRCKLACHRKCFDKVAITCGNNNKSSNKLVFGSPLSSLITEECRIPLVVEHLIAKIELKGLYAEGIYRKSARLTSINELKQMFDAQRADIDLDHYSVHVLAGCLKLFFREMPEPLMTYELYDDFLWATTVTDPTERNQIILNHISKLPKPNFDLLERLTFHLARVARQESANRMNANSLAIVFAPCILRTNKSMQMQDKLNDISKQTICIESIISEQMRQISDTLNDIDILDTACHTASSRLSSIRHSKMNMNRDSTLIARPNSSNVDDEEEFLAQQISELITEKNHLTTILPTFRIASACSDEDILSSNENEEMANTNASSDECLNTTNNNNNINSDKNPQTTTTTTIQTLNTTTKTIKSSATATDSSTNRFQSTTSLNNK